MEQTKNDLRLKLKESRGKLSSNDMTNKSGAITKSLESAIDWSGVRSVHTYLPISDNNEVDTWRLLQWLWSKYPKIVTSTSVYGQSRSMRHVIIDSTTKYREDSLGIPIPVSGYKLRDSQYDAIIVPVLGFDEKLNRIGYGQGTYDSFLGTQSETIKIGLAYELSKSDKIPVKKHDQVLDIIVTEKTIYRRPTRN